VDFDIAAAIRLEAPSLCELRQQIALVAKLNRRIKDNAPYLHDELQRRQKSKPVRAVHGRERKVPPHVAFREFQI
jgi:hypothetical protein